MKEIRNSRGGVPKGPPPIGETNVSELRWTVDHELERIKAEALRELLLQVNQTALWIPLRRAANEAAALAWMEPWPLLVFPELFAEKVRTTRKRMQQQERVRAKSAAFPELLQAA